MSTSESDNSSPRSRGRARRSLSHASCSSSPKVKPATSRVRRQEYRYIKGLSDRQRVDKILSDLQEEHRWTIKYLLYHMVTREPLRGQKWAVKPQKQAKDLSKAIFEQ